MILTVPKFFASIVPSPTLYNVNASAHTFLSAALRGCVTQGRCRMSGIATKRYGKCLVRHTVHAPDPSVAHASFLPAPLNLTILLKKTLQLLRACTLCCANQNPAPRRGQKIAPKVEPFDLVAGELDGNYGSMHGMYPVGRSATAQPASASTHTCCCPGSRSSAVVT